MKESGKRAELKKMVRSIEVHVEETETDSDELSGGG